MGVWSKLFGGTPAEPKTTSSAAMATGGFFVFDYKQMDTSYGEQAFTAICSALKGREGHLRVLRW